MHLMSSSHIRGRQTQHPLGLEGPQERLDENPSPTLRSFIRTGQRQLYTKAAIHRELSGAHSALSSHQQKVPPLIYLLRTGLTIRDALLKFKTLVLVME